MTKSIHEQVQGDPNMVDVIGCGCIVNGVRDLYTRIPPIDGMDRGAEAMDIVHVDQCKGPS